MSQGDFSFSQFQFSYLRCASHIARRLPRNTGWWQMVWNKYSEKQLKYTFCVSRKTFTFISSGIRHKLERQTVCKEPVSHELCLAICLYCLSRGNFSTAFQKWLGWARGGSRLLHRSHMQQSTFSCTTIFLVTWNAFLLCTIKFVPSNQL